MDVFGGSAWNAAQGSGWLDRRGYQPLVATSQMLKIDFLKIHQLTWIIVRDELMGVLFASFSVGVLVLVPVGCLWIIPEGVLDLDSYEKKLAVKFTANYL